MTFRISKQTELTTLRAIACDYWGLSSSQYILLNDQGELDCDLDPMFEADNAQRVTTVARFFETYLQSKRPDASKSALFYLSSCKHQGLLKQVLTSQVEAVRAAEAAGT